jgi:asparagine synthase (glutamine-hydrolysing)
LAAGFLKPYDLAAMCGIVACFGDCPDSLALEMMRAIRHRGPDGQGIMRIGDSLLGHVRLSILDVEGGGQPMANERGDLALSFNGEIYNHLEIRARLEGRHAFRSRADSEVILHSFEEEGEDALGGLDGMFAIALAGPKGLLLARDPLGIKPLYYGRRGSAFLAASELKAFPRMDELRALPPGHAVRPFGEPWRFAAPFPPLEPLLDPPLPEILGEIRRRLEAAVLKRLMSDVPVGVYLSGGLDSSLIAALMRPHSVRLHSFTAGMEGAADLEAARVIADFLGTDHHELIYSAEEVKAALPEVIRYLESFDAPLVRSAVPMYFVSRLAAESVKVVLSGEGADEIFAGYSYLAAMRDEARLRRELNDITTRLQDTNLQRTDRMSMAHGLEARVPFLDQSLVRYACRLPVSLLAHRPDRAEKWLLREACRGLIPSRILERKKMKFSDGAGSGDVVARMLEGAIDPGAFERERIIEPGLELRSPEELHCYRIWREVMGDGISSRLVGRTLDRTAGAQQSPSPGRNSQRC